MIREAFQKVAEQILKPVTVENEYIPRAKGIVCVQKVVYPKGKPEFSKNGTGEWYGITEN